MVGRGKAFFASAPLSFLSSMPGPPPTMTQTSEKFAFPGSMTYSHPKIANTFFSTRFGKNFGTILKNPLIIHEVSTDSG